MKPLSVPDELVTIQYRLQDSKGNYRTLKDQFIRQYDKNGEVVAIEGLLYELSYSATKDQLFKQLKAYRDAIDESILSSTTDVKGNILATNKEFCKVSKYSEKELIGQNHRIICSGHHSARFFEGMWKTITSGKMWRGEVKNRAKDGTYYWVDTIILPVTDTNDTITNFLSLRTLITKQKQADEQKREYVKFLEDIVFTVSHRVRAPLCSILGLTNLLISHKESPENFEEALSRLKLASDQLDRLTKELSSIIQSNDLGIRMQNYIEKNKSTG